MIPAGLLPAGAARAQHIDATLEAGVANVAYDRYARSSAFVVAPTVALAGARGSVEARGALSFFEGGSRSLQGGGAGELRFLPAPSLALALRGDLGATAYNDVTPIVYGRTELVARYRVGALLQLTAGPTLGFVTNAPSARQLLGFTAGAWLGDTAAAGGVRVTPARVGSLSYADTELWGGWTRGRVEVGGSAGVRAGELGAGARAWVNGGVGLRITRDWAAVAGAGAYPAELIQGVPGGRFATVALRLRSSNGRRTPPPGSPVAVLARAVGRAQGDAAEPAPGAASRLTVTSGRAGRRTLRLRAPGGGVVELMGDFTAWEPRALTRAADGWWELDLPPLAPGPYRVNVRVDGGPWTVPGGTATVEDDYGGVAGVLTLF